MAESLPMLSESANLAKVSAAFKSPGEYFEAGNQQPKMTFVEAVPEQSRQKMGFGSVSQPKPIDSWNERKQSR